MILILKKGITEKQLEDLKEILRSKGYLVKEIGGDWTGFVPGGDPDRITVQEVVANVEGGRRDIPDGDHDTEARAAGRGRADYRPARLRQEHLVQAPGSSAPFQRRDSFHAVR